jgi:hypothetical protein
MARPSAVGTVEALEEPRELGLLHADPVVARCELDRAIRPTRHDE